MAGAAVSPDEQPVDTAGPPQDVSILPPGGMSLLAAAAPPHPSKRGGGVCEGLSSSHGTGGHSPPDCPSQGQQQGKPS